MEPNPYESPQPLPTQQEPDSFICRLFGHKWTTWEVERGRYPRRWRKCSRCGRIKGKDCQHTWQYNDFIWRRDCTTCDAQETFGT